MKLSKYTIVVENYPETGKHLTYNTKSQALVVINESIRQVFRKLPLELEEIPQDTRPILAKLLEMEIIVQDSADELELVREWFETLRYSTKKLDVYIMTAYFCNFACPYCFEGKVKEQKKFLKKETADSIIHWIQNKAMETNPEIAEIVYYGGEPLVNIPMVEYISERLHHWFAQTPWKFGFNIITNGALVSEALVDKLNPLGLHNLRITVDGDKEYHDQYRPFLNGKGSYDVIMRNIKAVADKTSIVLLSNFNTANYSSLYTFLDHLEAEGLKDKIAQIDFKPITERSEEIPDDSLAQSDFECDMFHSKKMIALKEELIRRGFRTSKSLDGSGICHLKGADNRVIIDTDGLIYKCPAMVGRADRACGSVEEDIKSNPTYKDFMSFDIVEWKGKCSTCQFLPFCAGGCNYHAELQSGSYKNVFCEKPFYSRTIHDYIKIRYQQIMGQKMVAGAKRSVPTPI